MVDYRDIIRRHITDQVKEALPDTPTVLVNGARQTGKSTLVQSEELGEQNRQYLTFDDPSVLAAAKGDPNGFVAGLNPRVTLDEIQHGVAEAVNLEFGSAGNILLAHSFWARSRSRVGGPFWQTGRY